MFHNLTHSFSFILWSARTAKSTILQFFMHIRSGLLGEIRWSVCMSKSPRSLCMLFSRTGAWLCIYHLLVWSNLNFLHISLCITLPTQSCLVLYSFCANSLHSLIMWLIVSSVSPHSLHLLFCCVRSILGLIWLVLTALFCAAIRRDSVSLLKFPFLSQVKVLSYEMLFICRLKRPWNCFPTHFCYLVIVILLSIVLSVLHRVFVYCLPVVVSRHQRCLQCRKVLFISIIHCFSLYCQLVVFTELWMISSLFRSPGLFFFLAFWLILKIQSSCSDFQFF